MAITAALVARRVGFMLIRRQAVLLHGGPRLTEDIDVTLALRPGRLTTVPDVCAALGLEPLPRDG